MSIMARHLIQPSFHVTSVVGDKFIPGLRTSATFLTSLSANLRIQEDELYPTPISTPLFRRNSDTAPLPSLSHFSTMTLPHDAAVADAHTLHNSYRAPAPSTSPLADVPELTTYRAKSEEDRIAALRLVADSVAQQRQTTSRALIYHPISLGVVGIVLAVLAQLLYRDLSSLPLLMTTMMGFTMTGLVGVRWLTSGYIKLAEAIGWDWLGDDMLLVTKWGDDIIGAVVLGWAMPESPVTGSRKGKKKNEKKKWGIVRAWTVNLKYRGQGVGKALLEEAVQEVVKKGGEGIEFADEHANHNRVLHPFFNGFMDKGEQNAVNTLHEISRTQGNFGRRRS